MRILLILFLFWYIPAQIPGKLACYKQLGINEGLTQSTVEAVVRDNKGMLWIGTAAGLNLYDCPEIITLHHHPDDPQSLPSDKVYTLQEDENGNIWVGTQGGLAVLHPSGLICETLTDNTVYTSIRLDRKLFFGGIGMFYLHDMDTGEFSSIPVPSKKYLYLTAEDGDNLLIGTFDGFIFRYHISTGKLIPVGQTPFGNIYGMFRTSGGKLYFSAYKDGVYQLDADLKVCAHWTSHNSGLSHDIVSSFMEKDGRLYCATDGGGICALDTSTGLFVETYLKSDESGSIPTNSINYLSKDDSGNIWAGTVRNGLLYLKASAIRTFVNVPENYEGECCGLSEKTIASLFEDEDGRLWIGTDGNGLNSYTPGNNRFRHYRSTHGMSICSITDLNTRELLITTFNHGVFRFDKLTGKISRFLICDEETDKAIRKATVLIKAHRITEDKILITGKGIIIYDIKKDTFTEPDIGNLKHPVLTCTDDSGAYLISNYGNDEIYRMDKAANSVSLVKKLNSGESIKTVTIGHDGIFHIGTELGLTIFNPSSDSVYRYKTDLFTSVTYLTCDRADRLWISADNSLFTIEKGEITSWGESDGFKPNEINNTYQNRPNGVNMYMGGTEGLVKIETNHITIQNETPTISLREASVDGIHIHPELGKIQISHRYRVFNVSVCSDESDVFRIKKYRYTIRKSDLSRSIIYGANQLTLPALSDGKYSITAACLKRNGEWTEEFPLANFTILRPWYRSAVAILLYLSAIFSGAGIVIIRERRKIAELRKAKDIQEKHALYCRDYSLLIIDSSLESTLNLKEEISRCFNKIYCAPDAEKGLILARDKKPDIILTELTLPGINGMELCRTIKEDSSICNATVIIMSGPGEPDTATQGYREGADYFIYKPFDMDLLINISYNCLKNKERFRQQYRQTTELLTKKESGYTLSDEQFSIELKKIILENLMNPELNVEFLMKKMNYGRTTFYSRVKTVTGMSVTDFINMTRISRAKHIIGSTQLTLSEIAYRVGCSSLSRFSILFKQYTGMTPTEYKKTI